MPFGPPSEPVIRRAEDADLPGITWLRRERTAERDGGRVAAYRNQGIGTKLLNAVLGYANEKA